MNRDVFVLLPSGAQNNHGLGASGNARDLNLFAVSAPIPKIVAEQPSRLFSTERPNCVL